MITQKLLSISLLGTEWILYLLVLLSVLSWAIIGERVYFLKKKQGNMDALTRKMEKFLHDGKWEELIALLEKDHSSSADVGRRIISYALKNGDAVEDYLSVVLSQEKLRLESRTAFLGTVVSIAPFLGLLGTVLGIINAFHGLSLSKQGENMVMAGISEALVATALGLFIAIPAAAAYNYFVRAIKKIVISSENFAQFLLISFPRKEERGAHVFAAQGK